jgi:hypothetical protein
MKTYQQKYLFLLLLLTGLLIAGHATASVSLTAHGDIKSVMSNIEKAILQASELHDQGKIQKGRPLVVPVASNLELIFTAENFSTDLDKAFELLDQLMTRSRADRANTAASQLISSPSPSAVAGPKTSPPPPDRLTALMQAERQTAKVAPAGEAPNIPLEYSVYSNYRQTRLARIQEGEMMIEAEKQAVIAERQAAAQNQQRRRERDQQLQGQATAWQAELDKQAKASAAAALQWQQENSFGAYMKQFLGMVVQTSVGAFTGGFLGTVSTNLANKAVSNLFPDASDNIYSQAAAAGTSAAITQTGTAVGQSVGQQAASTVMGQSGGAAQRTATSGLGQYAPPKY